MGSRERLSRSDQPESKLIGLETRLKEREKRVSELETVLQTFQDRLSQKEQQLQDLEAHIGQLQVAGQGIKRELEDIHSSLSWKILTVYWRVVESHRATKRSLGYHGRKTLGRLIPPRLRWTIRQRTSWGIKGREPGPWTKSEIPVSRSHEVLCFPLIDWDFRIQRPQHLMRQFASAGHRVFYVSLNFRSLGTAFKTRRIEKNIYEVSLRGPRRNVYSDAMDSKSLEDLFSALESLRVDLNLGATVSFVQLPFWQPLAKRLRDTHHWPVVYDCMDYHAGFSTNKPEMLDSEVDLIRTADTVLATSGSLMEYIQRHNQKVHLLPNACDFEHFSGIRTKEATSSLVVGYYGAIADWFDSDLVADLAEKRPDWSFQLIGSTFSADLSRLSTCHNVFFQGEKAYDEIPRWIETFDVLIIPFRRTPLTDATNPVKAYEILAAGKPLVAVPLPELQQMRPLVQIGASAEEFEREIEKAVRNDTPELVEMRKQFAQDNTWGIRFRALKPVVDGLFERASVVVITYNNLVLNRLCLESIFSRTTWPNFEVIVVDNGSSDATPEYLKRAEREYSNLKVILNDRNLGFPAANNVGLRHASGDYLVLLNNDTVVSSGWLTGLIKHLKKDPSIGLIGPVTNEIGNEARILVGYRKISNMPAWAAKHVRRNDGLASEIPVVAMFCLAMRREVQEKIGDLDERFELGTFEDDDYTRRARNAGYKIVCARDVFIHHFGQASFDLLGDEKRRSVFEANRKRFEDKWGEKWRRHHYSEGWGLGARLMSRMWKALSDTKSSLTAHSVVRDGSNYPPPRYFSRRFGHFQGEPSIRGRCNICNQETVFFCDDASLCRESLFCDCCLTISRYRSIARGVLRSVRTLTGVTADSISELASGVATKHLSIYDTQAPFYFEKYAYPLPDMMSRSPRLEVRTSLYRPDRTFGANLGKNITNQNLEALTFPDDAFDIVITSDVMEHIRLDDRAHGEVARVLKPGGIYLFTVPHFRDRRETLKRVKIVDPEDPKKDCFVMEREYHGDANSAEGRALSYRTYGTDLDFALSELGFEVTYEKQDFPEMGIMNTELFTCRLLE